MNRLEGTCIICYLEGRISMVFSNVSNIRRYRNGIIFEEDGIEYAYRVANSRLYLEDNNQGPCFERYEIMDAVDARAQIQAEQARPAPNHVPSYGSCGGAEGGGRSSFYDYSRYSSGCSSTCSGGGC